jgi:hypothetical protein
VQHLTFWQKFVAAIYVGALGVLLGVFSSGLYDVGLQTLDLSPALLAAVALVLLCMVAVLFHWMLNPLLNWLQSRLYQKQRFRIMMQSPREVGEPRQHLIVLTSLSRTPPVLDVVRWHYENNKEKGQKLQRVWMILGPGTGDASPQHWFETLRTDYAAKGDGPEFVPLPIDDTENPETVFKCVNRIYARATSEGIAADQIIADMTGGTKSMTVGLVLACLNADRDLQYLKPLAQDPATGRADPTKGSVPWLIDTDFITEPVPLD